MFTMRMPKSKTEKRQHRDSEVKEIKLLESWINSGKPNSGSNPLLFPPLPEKSPVGPLPSGSFSPYAGAAVFQQLPLSIKTKKGLASEKYVKMTDIQRASLPHSLCGRDVLGAAKTGSGKTLAFVIPVLETLYRVRWGPEDGVGCIILSPTRELASQLFGVLKGVGKYHGFSAGLLIGGRKGVDTEKEHVNHLNILVSTPGRLLQHMDETPNFDCSQLQILVLDEADRLLDVGFKEALNAIISQLPKRRQTLLFSATQTKSVEDLQRLALKDQEYISVHEEAPTATPDHLEQKAVIVPLDEKLDVLWSFIKRNLNSRILVFLSTCKQVKFVFEVFKKLHPGIPLKCLHGRMNQEKRLGIYEQFCDTVSVLFSTDVASRGLDFKKSVDWVVQVDCPDDVASYIHRVGRTARYYSGGKSILFLTPSETKMFERLQERKIPIRLSKANQTRLQPVSRQLADLLVKYPDLRSLAQRAFITYLKSIHKQRDKDVFDVTKLPIEKFAESLGLPLIPKVRFLKQKVVRKKSMKEPPERNADQITFESSRASIENGMHVETGLGVDDVFREKDDQHDDLFFQEKSNQHVVTEEPNHPGDHLNTTGISKKRKKLKININRPGGTRVVFDDEGNSMHPLAKLSEVNSDPDSVKLDMEKVSERYAKMKEEMKVADKEDKALDRQRMREKRIKQKIKMKKRRGEDIAPSNTICELAHENKKPKIDDDINPTAHRDAITIAEQEELALKLLSSMHS